MKKDGMLKDGAIQREWLIKWIGVAAKKLADAYDMHE